MYEFPFELDDFQKEACKYISEGKSVVVCAPTGAGKTVIAQHAIHCALEKGEKVFYTTPLKALSNQKYSDFSEKYGQEKVGLLTGDTSINRGAQIVVMTTEVFRNMLYGTNFGSVTDNLKDVRYVILDEVHYMNDEQRGTVWEESIIYCPTNVQIIALSATVANADKLTEWINTVHSRTELVNTDFRPVPLRFYYFDSSQPNTLLPLLTPNGTLNKKIKPEKKVFQRGKAVQKKNTVKDVVRNLHEKMLNGSNSEEMGYSCRDPAVWDHHNTGKSPFHIRSVNNLNRNLLDLQVFPAVFLLPPCAAESRVPRLYESAGPGPSPQQHSCILRS